MSARAVAWASDVDAGTPGATKVLWFLAAEADEQQSCSPGREAIAAGAGIGVRSVARHLTALEKSGLVIRRARPRVEGRGRDSDLLFLAVPAQFGRNLAPDQQATNRPLTGHQRAKWPVGPRPLTAFPDLSQSQNLSPPGSPPRLEKAPVTHGPWLARRTALDALPGPGGCDDWDRSRGHPECRRVAGLILDVASQRATHPLTRTEQNRLRPFVAEWVQVGYAPEAIADAAAFAPAKTEPSVGMELRRRARPHSVGADGVDAARRWIAGDGA